MFRPCQGTHQRLMSPLAGTKHTYVRLAIIIYCQILALFFKFVNGILRNWESLCDIRPDCHHHFDASGTRCLTS